MRAKRKSPSKHSEFTNPQTEMSKEPRRLNVLTKEIVNHPEFSTLDEFRKQQIEMLYRRKETNSKINSIVSDVNTPNVLKHFASSVGISIKKMSRGDCRLLRNVWRHLFLKEQLTDDYLNC